MTEDKKADGMTPDEKADVAIKAMIAGVVGTAFIPIKIPFAVSAPVIGGGVVAIGRCYGVQLSKDEAWHLIMLFVKAAGIWIGGGWALQQMFSAIITYTGIGYPIAVTMDAVITGAFAYAIGETAKAYFKGVRKDKELREIMREKFKAKKDELIKQRKQQSGPTK